MRTIRLSSLIVSGAIMVPSLLFAAIPAASASVFDKNSAGVSSASYTTDGSNVDTGSRLSVQEIIQNTKASDSDGFQNRKDIIASSDAFIVVLQNTTRSVDLSLEFFAAISTEQQAKDLVTNTSGKHFVIEGTQSNPNVYLAEGEPIVTSQASSMPRCAAAWAAFSAWLAATTMTCAVFSGPAAWVCAVGMGFWV